jgi:hypothetical protein
MKDFEQRSLNAVKNCGRLRETADHLVDGDDWEFLGKGRHKRAWKVKIPTQSEHSGWIQQDWCIKHPIESDFCMRTELEIGMIATTIFYEMCDFLKKKKQLWPSHLFFCRPVECTMPFECVGDDLVHKEDAKTKFILEGFLRGTYTKHVNQWGETNTKLSALQANARRWATGLCHFSYWFMQGAAVLADVQGDHEGFTDPVIHTADGRSSVNDHGQHGMDICAHMHKCNDVCEKLGLAMIEMEEGSTPPVLPASIGQFTTTFSNTRKQKAYTALACERAEE